MNKYQEALDYLASLWEIEGEITVKSDPFDRFNRVETLIEDKVRRADRGNVKILQELVDKETPMKVLILKKQYEVETEMYRNYGECPKCNHSNLIGQYRCDECGQKLDWSDK